MRNPGAGGGFRFHVGTNQLREAGRNGGRKRHGLAVVYIDGAPVILQDISAETGVSVERLSDRVKSARARGEPITLEMLRRPLRQQRKPAKPAPSGYVVRKALR
jgi:hypothetical protein